MLNRMQKEVLLILIMYLVFIVVFTYTEISNEFSVALGLRLEGYYLDTGVFIQTSRGLFWPSHSAFLSYSIIGIIVFTGIIAIAADKKDRDK